MEIFHWPSIYPFDSSSTNTLASHCTCLAVYKPSCLLKQNQSAFLMESPHYHLKTSPFPVSNARSLAFGPLWIRCAPARALSSGQGSVWVGSTWRETRTRTSVIKMQIAGKAWVTRAPTPYTHIIHFPPVAKSGSGRLHSDSETWERENQSVCETLNDWIDI